MKKLICTLLALAMLLSAAALAEAPTEDRAGNPIAIPESIEKIISLAPATTEILEAIGAKDKIIAVDTQTPLYVAGVDAGSMYSSPYYDNEGSSVGLAVGSGVLAAKEIEEFLGE